MAFFKRPKKVERYVIVGVHQVNGDLSAIEYLQNADPKWVESQFFIARNFGRSTFEWDGDDYELIKNRNITYTLNKLTSEEEKEVKAF